MSSHTKQHPYIPNGYPLEELTYRFARLSSRNERFSFEHEAGDPLVTNVEILTYILQIGATHAATQNEADEWLIDIFAYRLSRGLYRKQGQFVFFGPPPPRPVIKSPGDLVPEGWRGLRFCHKQMAEVMEAFGEKLGVRKEMSLVVKSACGKKRDRGDGDDKEGEVEAGEQRRRRERRRTEGGRKRRCVIL
jgi:hypothetical protein